MNMYQEELLDHYWHPHNRGNVVDPSFVATEHNPLCGDALTLSARVAHGILEDIQFTGEGCAISQASASLLTSAIKGKPLADIKKINESDMYMLLKVTVSPARSQCALLALIALKKGLHYAHT